MSSPKEIFNKYAAAYQERFMDLDLYNDSYDALCKILKPQAHVLEIGCGPGNITKYLLSKRPDLQILGIDLAENMIDLATQNCPTASFQVMDAKDILQLNKTFDAIICGFCMPYLSMQQCERLIKDSSHLLNQDGVFYTSVIEGDHARSGYETSSNGEDSCFINYYDEGFLTDEVKKYSMSIVYSGKKMFDGKEGSKDTHLILIAKK